MKRPLLKTFLATVRNARQAVCSPIAKAWLLGCTLSMLCAQAQAGILSRNLCRPYRQLVDNELFITIAVIAGVILIFAWKLAPSGSHLSKGIGLLAALTLGLNLENLMQTVFGTGLAC